MVQKGRDGLKDLEPDARVALEKRVHADEHGGASRRRG